MSAVKENQEEFFVVLKIDDQGSLQTVNDAIEPLLRDVHVDRIDLEMLGPDALANDSESSDGDVINEDDVRLLLEGVPPERHDEARMALTLLRAAAQSLREISNGSTAVAENAQDLTARLRILRGRMREASQRSKSKLAGLGF